MALSKTEYVHYKKLDLSFLSSLTPLWLLLFTYFWQQQKFWLIGNQYIHNIVSELQKHAALNILKVAIPYTDSFVFYNLSVGSTETKYIKLKTKTQNNIVISGIFHKKWYWLFLKKIDWNTSVYKKISSFSFSFLVFRLSNR